MYNCNIFRNLQNIRRIFPIQFSSKINNEYTPVYKFPYIRPAALVNRLKLYQSVLTALYIPGSFILCNTGIISVDYFVTTCIMGITGIVSLFLFGTITHKLVGFVYVKDDNKIAKISYIDFWGKRKDKEIPISDLVPLCDLPAIPTDPVYLTMRRFSSPETFKINLKFGTVLEKTKFNEIFLHSV